MIPPVSDIHTHNPQAVNAVINLERGAEPMRPEALYSAGWHPWWEGEPDLQWVERMAAMDRVVLIGECGLDRLRGVGPMADQLAVTEFHALLAERVGKPLLLHIVGAWSEIIALRKRLKPSQPWIIHGFRGKPQLARQLLDAGFHLSLGARFNPATEAIIPPERLLRETD